MAEILGTPNPLLTTFLAQGSLNFLKPDIVIEKASSAFPLLLHIEPTNACNLCCVMCPRHRSTRRIGYMDFEIYQHIVDECTERGQLLMAVFHKDGEPLLHSELPRMISYLRHRMPACVTRLNTNGLLLTDERACRLIEAGLHDITISVDADSAQSYRAIKGLDSFAYVLSNITNLITLRNRLGLTQPHIRVKIMRMPVTVPEIDAFVHRWLGVADEIRITGVHDWLGSIDLPFLQEVRDSLPQQYSCLLLWYSLAINWDGSISICCTDWNKQAIVGDLSAGESLTKVWQGERLKRTRQANLDGAFDTVICGKCQFWTSGINLDDWLWHQEKFYR